jgi:hypothetical protein
MLLIICSARTLYGRLHKIYAAYVLTVRGAAYRRAHTSCIKNMQRSYGFERTHYCIYYVCSAKILPP